MPETTITLTSDHALVMACVGAIHLTNFILGGSIGAARSKYKVAPPNLYAAPGMYLTEDGKIDQEKWLTLGTEFNKRQRGHQHIFEGIADAYAMLLTCGLFYPRYAAQWGVMWVIGTFGYAIGYAIKPGYRVFGELFYLPANIAWLYGIYCAGKAVYYGTPL